MERNLKNTQTAVTNNRYKRLISNYLLLVVLSDVCHRCLCVISDKTEMAKEKECLERTLFEQLQHIQQKERRVTTTKIDGQNWDFFV